jgi:hypothetical protein
VLDTMVPGDLDDSLACNFGVVNGHAHTQADKAVSNTYSFTR